MRVSGIVSNSIVDGLGIRMAIFFQGCPHHCGGCHNPDTWDYTKEVTEISVADVLERFDSDSLLTGITLSGGEPFSECNFVEILELCKAIKERKKNIWVYTGYTIEKLEEKYPEYTSKIFPLLDVLIDGPFILGERDLLLSFKGSKNQRLIDVPSYLRGEKDFCLKI